jgi:hypothetical protein
MILRAILLLIATGLLYKAFESNLTISASFGLLFSPLVFIISLFSVWISPGLLEQQSSKTYLIRAIGMLIILFGAWNVLSLR